MERFVLRKFAQPARQLSSYADLIEINKEVYQN
jgi:hypothetical protein